MSKSVLLFSKAGSRMKFVITEKMALHMGHFGSSISMNCRSNSNGTIQVWLRNNVDSRFRMSRYNSNSHPFVVQFSRDDLPFREWPDTPRGQPLEIEVEFAERRQLTFAIDPKAIGKGSPAKQREPEKVKPDPKDFHGALAGLRNQMAERKVDKEQPGVAPAAAVPFMSTQPQPQASPFKTAEDVPAEEKRERDIPPAHVRLNDILQILNRLLTVELNDIELFVEQIDEQGKAVKTIPLPVPSQMRLRGRRIREETFG